MSIKEIGGALIAERERYENAKNCIKVLCKDNDRLRRRIIKLEESERELREMKKALRRMAESRDAYDS